MAKSLSLPGPQGPNAQMGIRDPGDLLILMGMGGCGNQDCVAIIAGNGNTPSFHGILLSWPPYLDIYLPPCAGVQNRNLRGKGSHLAEPQHQLTPRFLASPGLSPSQSPFEPSRPSLTQKYCCAFICANLQEQNRR